MGVFVHLVERAYRKLHDERSLNMLASPALITTP